MKKFTTIACFGMIWMMMTGCGSGSNRRLDGGDTLTTEASLLTMVDYGDYIVADVSDPWSPEKSSAHSTRYVLVGRDYQGDIPEGIVVRVPVDRSVVFSGVYAGAIDELGRGDAIVGVADGQYFGTKSVVEGLKSGRIRDVGNSMSPSVEAIVDLDAGMVMMSPFENQDLTVVEMSGVPLVKMVDYMENTPLGRAEWIKLIGALYGRRAEADSTFATVKHTYNSMAAQAKSSVQHPVVLTEQPLSGGSWDVPAGNSYMARMLADAGAMYPWADSDEAGSLKLDAAAVFDKAQNADFWLIRSYGPLTRQGLAQGNALSSRFKAFGDGNVYVCDTSVSSLFDEFPFHPERLLGDYIAIFHPESGKGNNMKYYRRIE
ncbi:MAG: ABC transporter substrate-binding protein [Bacteroides sp.]|nr:ABC transporter substrate-binding protein [Bacteroides sp.]MCM1414080.1 ABC transporter substrate-binding protein [Bacteroides sp.]MCM1472321.1 ABC transporter substrate-binding protein [Bacteroides sp.]